MTRVIVGITGASGAIYGVRLLERLHELPLETHLVVTRWGRVTIEHETGRSFADVKELADTVHAENDQAAPISSGSFRTDGMIVAPCSVKTLAAIANGLADNLVARAADVVLKERRPLVLAVREAPMRDRKPGVDHDLVPVDAGGVAREAERVAKDGEVLVGLAPCRDRPHDIVHVGRIDVLVDHHDGLDPGAGGDRRIRCDLRL